MAPTQTMSMTTRKTVFCCFALTDIGEGFQPVVVASVIGQGVAEKKVRVGSNMFHTRVMFSTGVPRNRVPQKALGVPPVSEFDWCLLINFS